MKKLGFCAIAAAGMLWAAARPTRSLAGKVVLLTGGSRGFGLELARKLARERCKLIVVARSADELQAAVEELTATGADIQSIVCDLTNANELKSMLTNARNLHGRIDIVINNAGRIDVAPLDAVAEDDIHASMDLMFWAPVRIILQLLPEFLASGDADIVNISSIGGKIAVPHLVPYSAAKFALCGFSEGISAELRGRGVHVLTVMPGLLRTGSHKKARFKGRHLDEYRWFALGATVPGISMQVSRAAGQVVSALKARRSVLLLGWSAQLAARFHGAFPSASLALISAATSLLPSGSGDSSALSGEAVQQHQSAFMGAATVLGEVAAHTQRETL